MDEQRRAENMWQHLLARAERAWGDPIDASVTIDAGSFPWRGTTFGMITATIHGRSGTGPTLREALERLADALELDGVPLDRFRLVSSRVAA